MRTARFFVPEAWIALSAGAFAIPAGSIHKQIVNVLRMTVGDHVSLCPNDGTELDGVITEVTRSAIIGSIVGTRTGKPLRPNVTVCAAVTKRDTFEWMLQKCTELGASAFIPLMTDRVVKKTKDIPERWRDIVREASEQSGRTRLPLLHSPMMMQEALRSVKECDRLVFHESVGTATGMPAVKRMDHVALFIGPEGGFTPEEIAQCAESGCVIVQLDDVVMRAETAAVVATALVRLVPSS